MQERYEPAPDERIAAEPIVGALEGSPERGESRRFGPGAEHVMIVVLQHHAPAAPDRPHHVPHDPQRIADVLEHESRVRKVEGAPFVVAQRRIEHVAAAQIEKPVARSAFELLVAPLDPDEPHAGGLRHRERELPEAGAEVDDPLSAPQRELAQRRLVHEVVEEREPFLLGGRGAVQVGGAGRHRTPSNAIPSAQCNGYLSSVETQVRPASRPPSAGPTRPLEEIALARSTRSARIGLAALALVATALFLVVVFPFWSPLLLAAVLAAVFQQPLDRLTRAMGGRRRFAGALITIGVLVVIVLPFASIATFAARESISGFQYIRDTMGVQRVSDLKTAPLPPAVEKVLEAAHLTREQFHEFAAKAADRAQEVAPELLKSSGRAVFHTVLMLLAFFFLLVDGRHLIRWLWNVSPLQAEQTEELLTEFHQVSTGSIVGNLATALLQGVAMAVGLLIFGVPHAIFFGLLTAVASFIPVIGTALVGVPAVALLAFTGHPGSAIGLGVWYAVLVVGSEHLAKPFILRATSGGEMHTGLMFLALLGGLEVFGLLGVILGPLIVSFFVSLMRMLERAARPPAVLH